MEIKSLLSPEQKRALEEKKKKKIKYLGIALLFIMAISSIGYAFISSDKPQNNGQNEQQQTQEGIIESNGQWFANFGETQLVFSTSPDEAKNVSYKFNLTLQDYYQKKVYAVDSEKTLASLLFQNLGKYSTLSEACLGKCEEDLPEKNCTEHLIAWNRNASINNIKQEDKCIFIEGDIRAVDAFVYRIFGLI